MPPSLHNSTATEAAPRSRGPWLVVGAILWLIVGLTAVVIVRNRIAPPDLQTAETVAPDLQPIPETPENPSELDVSGPKLRRPLGFSDIWDPNGIRDFSLTERSGRTVTKADLLGKPWVVCFIFRECRGPCIDVTNSMVRLQKALEGTDVRLVSISVLPDSDTPEKLADYADGFGADPEKWLFLTGDKTQIYGLILKSFLMPVEELTGAERLPGFEVVHTTNIMLVDEHGVIRDKFDGRQPHEVDRLIAGLTPAVAELPEPEPSGSAAPAAEARP